MDNLMKEHHKKLLLKLVPDLTQNVKMSGLLKYLVRDGVLNTMMSKEIKNAGTDHDQVEKLVEELCQCDAKAFDAFCRALEENNQRHVADMLRDRAAEMLRNSENASQGTTSAERDRPGSKKRKRTTSAESDRPAEGMVAPSSSKKKKTCNDKVSKKRYEWHEEREDYCVVFNQFTKNRQGTVTDEEKLKSLFETELGFNYRSYENCSKEEFEANLVLLSSKIKQSKKPVNSLVVAIMSHGSKDGICTCLNDGEYGDGKYITIDEILNYFNASSLPRLIDCPKVFIVETCRGGIIQKGEQSTNDLPPECTLNDLMRTTPNDADILIAFSTLDGFSSIQEHDGSAYIKNLVDVLKTSYKQEHMVDMIIDLQDKIAAKEFDNIKGKTKEDGNKQMPCMVSTFRKRMYLGCHKKK